MTAAGAVAGVCYPLAAGALGVRYGWRAAPAVAAVATLAVLVATLVVVPRMAAVRPDRRLRDAFDSGLLGGLLSRPAVVYSIGVAVVGGYTFQAVSSFLPTFLVEYRALGTGEASLALGGVFALSAVAQPVAGRVSDARSRDLAIGASFALTAVGVGTLVVVPSLPGMVAGTVLLGVGVSWPGSVQARLMDQLDDAERGLGFGAVRTVYLLLSALGSAVTGALADAGGWPLAYGAVIVLLAACLLAMTLNRRVGPGL
jgi:predicted MFS family arabinose efflux permease